MNLFQVAHENAEALLRRFETVREAMGDGASQLDRFVGAVQSQGRLAVNMRPGVLLRFLIFEGSYQNIYEHAAEIESLTGLPRDEFLRSKLRGYYDLRLAFDSFLENGEQLRYGALNLGGLGAVHFGDYCLIFREAFAASLADLAYLLADSLKTYMLPGYVVDEAGLRRDACPHSHRHVLAALKHGAEAACLEEDSWPALICSRSGFIEALFLGTPSPADLQTVRIDRFDYDLYMSFVTDADVGRLGETDRRIVEEFVNLLRLLKGSSIRLETVVP
jgi:hypothetical protein